LTATKDTIVTTIPFIVVTTRQFEEDVTLKGGPTADIETDLFSAMEIESSQWYRSLGETVLIETVITIQQFIRKYHVLSFIAPRRFFIVATTRQWTSETLFSRLCEVQEVHQKKKQELYLARTKSGPVETIMGMLVEEIQACCSKDHFFVSFRQFLTQGYFLTFCRDCKLFSRQLTLSLAMDLFKFYALRHEDSVLCLDLRGFLNTLNHIKDLFRYSTIEELLAKKVCWNMEAIRSSGVSGSTSSLGSMLLFPSLVDVLIRYEDKCHLLYNYYISHQKIKTANHRVNTEDVEGLSYANFLAFLTEFNLAPTHFPFLESSNIFINSIQGHRKDGFCTECNYMDQPLINGYVCLVCGGHRKRRSLHSSMALRTAFLKFSKAQTSTISTSPAAGLITRVLRLYFLDDPDETSRLVHTTARLYQRCRHEDEITFEEFDNALRKVEAENWILDTSKLTLAEFMLSLVECAKRLLHPSERAKLGIDVTHPEYYLLCSPHGKIVSLFSALSESYQSIIGVELIITDTKTLIPDDPIFSELALRFDELLVTLFHRYSRLDDSLTMSFMSLDTWHLFVKESTCFKTLKWETIQEIGQFAKYKMYLSDEAAASNGLDMDDFKYACKELVYRKYCLETCQDPKSEDSFASYVTTSPDCQSHRVSTFQQILKTLYIVFLLYRPAAREMDATASLFVRKSQTKLDNYTLQNHSISVNHLAQADLLLKNANKVKEAVQKITAEKQQKSIWGALLQVTKQSSSSKPLVQSDNVLVKPKVDDYFIDTAQTNPRAASNGASRLDRRVVAPRIDRKVTEPPSSISTTPIDSKSRHAKRFGDSTTLQHTSRRKVVSEKKASVTLTGTEDFLKVPSDLLNMRDGNGLKRISQQMVKQLYGCQTPRSKAQSKPIQTLHIADHNSKQKKYNEAMEKLKSAGVSVSSRQPVIVIKPPVRSNSTKVMKPPTRHRIVQRPTFIPKSHKSDFFKCLSAGRDQQNIGLLEKAVDLSDNQLDISFKVVALGELAACYEKIENFTSCCVIIEQQLSIIKEMNDTHMECFILSKLGKLNLCAGRYLEAELAYRDQLEIATELLRSPSESYSNESEDTPVMKVQHEGSDPIERAIRLGISPALGGIGNALRAQGKYSSADEMYSYQLQAAKSTNHKDHIVCALANAGSLELQIGNFSKSLDYFFKELEIYVEYEMYGTHIMKNLRNIANLQRIQGDKENLYFTLSQLLETSRIIGDHSSEAQACLCLCNFYLEDRDVNNLPKPSSDMLDFVSSVWLENSNRENLYQQLVSMCDNNIFIPPELRTLVLATDMYRRYTHLVFADRKADRTLEKLYTALGIST